MIVLFTDFGYQDPYVGQMHAVLAQQAPGVQVIDLFHTVPDFDIRAAAYLLPAYTGGYPTGTVFVCVVDPGVGWQRRPVALKVDGCWYVGPDNGLFHILARRAQASECYVIRWRPPRISNSFHGRDLFAPVAAYLACGEPVDLEPTTLAPLVKKDWPDDLRRVLYIDHYGNAITGIRAESVADSAKIRVNGYPLSYARVFADAPENKAFWYRNSNGLVEIAVNQGCADRKLGLRLGDAVTLVD